MGLQSLQGPTHSASGEVRRNWSHLNSAPEEAAETLPEATNENNTQIQMQPRRIATLLQTETAITPPNGLEPKRRGCGDS